MFEDGSALKKIGPNAFYWCTNLANVALPEGLEEIGMYAFYHSDIDSVVFPSSLRTVHQGAFSDCKSLKTVVLNEGLEVLGTNEHKDNGCWYNGVFHGSAIESVTLPFTLKRIEYSAFRGCTNLKSVTLPEKLEYIGKYSF